MHAKKLIRILQILSSWLWLSQPAPASPVGSAFTYQGWLFDGTQAVSGTYDLTFTLYDTENAGNRIGASLTKSAVPVANGLLMVQLDFGLVWDGGARWLEIAQRPQGGGAFTTFTPRQPVTATPYANYALAAGTAALANSVPAGVLTGTALAPASLTADKLSAGQVVKSVNGLKDDLVLAPGSNVSFTTNGNTLTIAAADGGGVTGGWSTSGNAGTSEAFLGTTDHQPLRLVVNSQPVLVLEEGKLDAPNLRGGSANNSILTYGSTIGGGDKNVIDQDAAYSFIGGGEYHAIRSSAPHSFLGGGNGNAIRENAAGSFIGGGEFNNIALKADHGVLCGGYLNAIQTNAVCAFLGGGWLNTNDASYSVVPGGRQNYAGGLYSFAAGRRAKAIYDGDFVWADSQEADFTGMANDQFLIRAKGGVGINKNNPTTALDVNGTVAATAFSGNGAALTSLNGVNLAPSSVDSSAIAPGQVVKSLNGLADTVALVPGANVSFTTNGNTLTIAAAGGGATGGWSMTGNAGTTLGANFLGTTDNQPLELKVNGQRALRLEPTLADAYHAGIVNVLGGSAGNYIAPGVVGSVIGGGGAVKWNSDTPTNSVSANFAFLGGGFENSIQLDADISFLGGGLGNSIQRAASSSFLGGGQSNSIQTNAHSSFLGGGEFNTNGAPFSVVPGGSQNCAAGRWSFAAGQRAKAIYKGDFVWADSQDADFTGSADNQFLIRAAGGMGINTNNPNGAALNVNGTVTATAFVGDGSRLTGLALGGVADGSIDSVKLESDYQSLDKVTGGNMVVDKLSGIISKNNMWMNDHELFLRGSLDSHHGLGWYGPGGNSFANLMPEGPVLYGFSGGILGTRQGAGIETAALSWDSFGRVTIDPGDFDSGSLDQGLSFGKSRTEGIASRRTAGGNHFGLDYYTDNKIRMSIANNGNVGIGKTDPATALDVKGTVTATAFNPPSDRNLKEHLSPIDAREALEKVAGLAISRWNFKGDETTPHVGPMAQDFYAAFHVGTDDKHIATVDADGVALAAIQGLNRKVEQENAALRKELAAKTAELRDLRQTVSQLEEAVARLNGESK